MQLVWAGLILFVCGYIQTIAGFAFSLLAVPLLLLCGFDLTTAVVFSMATSVIQRLLLTWHCRKSIVWKQLYWLLPFSLIGLAIGVFTLKVTASLDPDVIKQIFGVILLGAVALRIFSRVEPRDHVPFWIGAIASFLSGILNGFANIAGPPLVLWTLAHKWPKDRLRATISAFTSMMVPLQVVLLILNFGSQITITIGKGFLFMPLIFLSVWLGNHSTRLLSVRKIRILIMLLLLLTGAIYILTPMLKKFS
ncbi:MAG: sulfite exporter TauE/SafE family protein [Lentisphaerae bacterium]|nr:sulfite exporter TauE/SafE family protein [Lentisphaerota bacterium]MCP4100230.1 sulfite exporter TauE/SafE family protein [Lentisphaerota bacterium]